MQHNKHNEQWPNNRRNVYAALIPWHIFRIKNFFVSLHSTRARYVSYVTLQNTRSENNESHHEFEFKIVFFVVVAASCSTVFAFHALLRNMRSEGKKISFDSIKRVHSIIIWLCFCLARAYFNQLTFTRISPIDKTANDATANRHKQKTYNLIRLWLRGLEFIVLHRNHGTPAAMRAGWLFLFYFFVSLI